MKVNFTNVDDVQDFTPLPDDIYLFKLVLIEEATTQTGYDMWKLRFEVVSGPYEGRFIFDNMVFSEKAMRRVKLICYTLGVDITQEVDLTPELLLNKYSYVTVVTEDFEDNTGVTKQRNSVPFAGYGKADDAAVQMALSTDEDVPF